MKIYRNTQWNPSLSTIPENATLFAMQRSLAATDLQGLLPAPCRLAEHTLEVNVDEKGVVGFRANKQGAFTSLLAFGFAVDEVVGQFCA